jgi:hypothetical protein
MVEGDGQATKQRELPLSDNAWMMSGDGRPHMGPNTTAEVAGTMPESPTRLGWLARTPWANVAIAACYIGVPFALWVSQPRKVTFPNEIVTALGVLLTTLVFLLTFGNSHFKATAEKTVDRLKAREAGLLSVVGDASLPGSWRGRAVDVARDHRIIAKLLLDVHLSPAARIRWLDRRRTLKRDLREANLRVSFSDAEVSEARAAEARRIVSKIKSVEDFLDGKSGSAYWSSDQSELVESVDYELNEPGRQLHTANLVIGAMLSLTAIGAVYAHWRATGPVEPQAWVVATIILTALIYTATVSKAVRTIKNQTARTILRLPLTSLFELQQFIPSDSLIGYRGEHWMDLRTRGVIEERWKDLILRRLDDVLAEQPSLPWAHELRALYSLCLARWDGAALMKEMEAKANLDQRQGRPGAMDLDEIDSWYKTTLEERMGELEGSLRTELTIASQHLSIASPDDAPLTLVAQASVTELVQNCGVRLPPDVQQILPAAPLSRASDCFASSADDEGIQVTLDAELTLKMCSWIKPVDARLESLLNQALQPLSQLSHRRRMDVVFRLPLL